MRPLRINGRIIHQIGLPYHWASKGLVRGDSANELISFVADPERVDQEIKALTGNHRAGRGSRERRCITSGRRAQLPPAKRSATCRRRTRTGTA